MAEHLRSTTQRLLRRIACAATWLLVAGGHAYGETLADPTRPPSAPRVQSAIEPPPAAVNPVLQSIFIWPDRVLAIINGETVRVGDKVGDAHVARITEGEVVLRSGNGTRSLTLFPIIRMTQTPAPAQRSGLQQ
jgi:MSHA biogenesis protein MshK